MSKSNRVSDAVFDTLRAGTTLFVPIISSNGDFLIDSVLLTGKRYTKGFGWYCGRTSQLSLFKNKGNSHFDTPGYWDGVKEVPMFLTYKSALRYATNL